MSNIEYLSKGFLGIIIGLCICFLYPFVLRPLWHFGRYIKRRIYKQEVHPNIGYMDFWYGSVSPYDES